MTVLSMVMTAMMISVSVRTMTIPMRATDEMQGLCNAVAESRDRPQRSAVMTVLLVEPYTFTTVRHKMLHFILHFVRVEEIHALPVVSARSLDLEVGVQEENIPYLHLEQKTQDWFRNKSASSGLPRRAPTQQPGNCPGRHTIAASSNLAI